jgi:hypothetical protein
MDILATDHAEGRDNVNKVDFFCYAQRIFFFFSCRRSLQSVSVLNFTTTQKKRKEKNEQLQKENKRHQQRQVQSRCG